MPAVLELLQAWGLIVVIVNVLADQSGLPVPSFPTLVAASALGPAAGVQPLHVFAAAVAAALGADALWYAAGLRRGHGVLCRLCSATTAPDACVHTTESAFARFGLPSVLVAKFVPGFSALTAALAGSSGVPLWRYVAVDVVGAVLWAGTAVVVGILFRDAVAETIAVVSRLGAYGLLLALAAASAIVLIVAYPRRRGRSARH